jgi:hypothetical protein
MPRCEAAPILGRLQVHGLLRPVAPAGSLIVNVATPHNGRAPRSAVGAGLNVS